MILRWACSLSVLLAFCGGVYGESALDCLSEAQMLQKQGNIAQALKLYTQSLHMEPQRHHADKIYNNRGLIYYAQGK